MSSKNGKVFKSKFVGTGPDRTGPDRAGPRLVEKEFPGQLSHRG